jgi:hypothetical protein
MQSNFKEAVACITISTKNILVDMTLTDCNIVEEINSKSPINSISENLAQLVAAFN